MNLSPSWVPVLERNEFSALHWSAVGDGRAPDPVIFRWAQENSYVVFTNDLGFGAILAATGASGPSVIQVRTQGLTPERLAPTLVSALRQYAEMRRARAPGFFRWSGNLRPSTVKAAETVARQRRP